MKKFQSIQEYTNGFPVCNGKNSKAVHKVFNFLFANLNKQNVWQNNNKQTERNLFHHCGDRCWKFDFHIVAVSQTYTEKEMDVL